MNQALTLYNSAKRALAEYKTVDEVKSFRDKALAIEAYAKQANDYDLERDAAVARVRAERKCGELLAETDKQSGARGKAGPGRGKNGVVQRDSVLEQPKTLAEMGITKDQSSKWQKLAQVPEREFEEAINLPGSKPTTNHILRKEQPPPERMDGVALWWWGRLVDIEREKMAVPLYSVVEEMTDAMRSDAERIIPKLKKWIADYEQK